MFTILQTPFALRADTRLLQQHCTAGFTFTAPQGSGLAVPHALAPARGERPRHRNPRNQTPAAWFATESQDVRGWKGPLGEKWALRSLQPCDAVGFRRCPCVSHQWIKTRIIPETALGLCSLIHWGQEAALCSQEQFMGVKYLLLGTWPCQSRRGSWQRSSVPGKIFTASELHLRAGAGRANGDSLLLVF